jgi:hypothetical protein
MSAVIRFDRNGQKITAAPVKRSVDAPYVEPDRSQLGDRHLDPKEAVIREREELLKTTSRSKIYGQQELEDQERSAGPRLSYTEIIYRLHKINPQLKVVDGIKGSVAIYRPKFYYEYDIQDKDPTKRAWAWDYKYVGGMEKQSLPEWSHLILDTSNLPVKEIRGWRSVILSCVKNRAITSAQADEQFGNPMFDSRSTRYREQVREFNQKKQQEKQYV